jgi:two-component system, cell cycle response regulator DivK
VTKILYVEDNDDNVYLLKMRFELLDGYEIIVAEDGEAGCAKAISDRPDLILMDLDVPVVDGWEATRRLKADAATSSIPVIALTVHAMSGSREKALAAGCDDFDTKPIDFDRLLHKIDRLLCQARK